MKPEEIEWEEVVAKLPESMRFVTSAVRHHLRRNVLGEWHIILPEPTGTWTTLYMGHWPDVPDITVAEAKAFSDRRIREMKSTTPPTLPWRSLAESFPPPGQRVLLVGRRVYHPEGSPDPRGIFVLVGWWDRVRKEMPTVFNGEPCTYLASCLPTPQDVLTPEAVNWTMQDEEGMLVGLSDPPTHWVPLEEVGLPLDSV